MTSAQLLSLLPPARRHRAMAAGAALLCLVVFIGLAPFAKARVGIVEGFIPFYQGALVINDLTTAALLLGQHRLSRFRPLFVLAMGYTFTALITFAHTLTFPGLFSPSGLLGAGMQTTAWLYMFWHAAFPIFVILYAVARPDPLSRSHQVVAALLVPLVVALLVVLATRGERLLPAIMTGRTYEPLYRAVVSSVWLMSAVAMAVLWHKRPRSLLDVWLGVVLCAWVADIGLSAVLNSGRFDLGFYAGRIFGLLAASFVLVVLLFEYATFQQRFGNALAELVRAAQDIARGKAVDIATDRRVVEVAALAQALQAASDGARERERLARSFAVRLQEDIDAERRRIARSFHDDLGQRLSVIAMMADIMRGGTRDAEQAKLLDGIRDGVRGAIESMRAIIADIRPAELELGLDGALAALLDDWGARSRLRHELVVEGSFDDLPDAMQISLYRMAQEALNNVSKHASASRVRVALQRTPAEVALEVDDDGTGIDLEASTSKDGRFGLFGMRERAAQFDGTLTITGRRGVGTTVRIDLPWPRRSAAARDAVPGGFRTASASVAATR